MEKRLFLLLALPGILAPLGFGAPSAATSSKPTASEGYLSRDLEILVYPADAGFESSPRGLTLRREVSLFEGYIWRYSQRRLAIDTRVTIIRRELGSEEFRDYGKKYGFLLDRSPQVEQDLHHLGETASSLIFLYDPPPNRPPRLAGRTFFHGTHSSIPLTPRYFEQHGFSRPLHLVLVHEYLHQLDLTFSIIRNPREFLDPDGVGRDDYPPCIAPGGGDLSLRTLLQFDHACGSIDWSLLSPHHGTWISR